MIDEIAKAICHMAARSTKDEQLVLPDCVHCNDGECTMWQLFRPEAVAAARAAYQWHAREKRWPSFVKTQEHRETRRQP